MVEEIKPVEEVNTIEKIPFDIIVPSHEKIGLLDLCINSIYQYTKSPFHLIVTDDSKDDLVQQWLERESSKRNFTYVHRENYKSGNAFFNDGLAHCKYDFVATVMNSIEVMPEWEVIPLQVLSKNPKVGTLGLKCLFPWGTIESAGIHFVGIVPTDIGRDMPSHLLPATYGREAVQWALAIHRKEALVGNLDENVFHGHVGWDDIDNCLALKKKGWQIMYCGAGVGYHRPRSTRGVASTDEDADERNFMNGENARIFYKRWGMYDQYVKQTGYREPAETPLNRAMRRRQEREKVELMKV